MIDESVTDGELEGSTQKKIWAKLSKLGCRLFRVNTGKAWLSNLGPRGVKKTPEGLLIRQARAIPLGFSSISNESVTGTLDLQGYTMVTVTPEMVGHRIAVYTCVDAKRAKGGKKTTEQTETIARVHLHGGIAGFANSPKEAEEILRSWFARFK